MDAIYIYTCLGKIHSNFTSDKEILSDLACQVVASKDWKSETVLVLLHNGHPAADYHCHVYSRSKNASNPSPRGGASRRLISLKFVASINSLSNLRRPGLRTWPDKFRDGELKRNRCGN
jgi:hypothetical protein